MDTAELSAWIECSLVFSEHRELFTRLYKDHGSLQSALKASGHKRVRSEIIHNIIADCEHHGIHIITRSDERFPEAFSACAAPILFYAKGDTEILGQKKTAGIIGARKASGYSLRVCSYFSRQLVKNGFVIVSGFACGTDCCAHSECIRSGGKTVAVLGCGIGCDYPKGSLELQNEIAENGVVISEYPPLLPPKREYFPQRNRLIAALSSKLLVIEASDKSGCLNTAGHALSQGKDVFVIPPHDISSPRFQGQCELIRDGAGIAFEPCDLY